MRLALTDNGRRWHHDRSDSIFSSQCKTDACRPPITFPRHLNLRIIGELDRGRLLLAIQPPWFDDVQLGMPDDKSNLLPSFCIQYVSNQSNSSVRLYSVVKLVQRQKSSAVAERPRDASCHWTLLSHSRSFETTLLSRACASPYYSRLFHWNYVSPTPRLVLFLRYSASKNGTTLKTVVGSFKVTENGAVR